MSWLIPEDENDRRPKVVLGYDWIVYFYLLTLIFIPMLLAFLTPLIHWLRDIVR
ncbi:MAG: hypothetical protein WEB58_03455 [Planctomycetaceae bacterium]